MRALAVMLIFCSIARADEAEMQKLCHGDYTCEAQYAIDHGQETPMHKACHGDYSCEARFLEDRRAKAASAKYDQQTADPEFRRVVYSAAACAFQLRLKDISGGRKHTDAALSTYQLEDKTPKWKAHDYYAQLKRAAVQGLKRVRKELNKPLSCKDEMVSKLAPYFAEYQWDETDVEEGLRLYVRWMSEEGVMGDGVPEEY